MLPTNQQIQAVIPHMRAAGDIGISSITLDEINLDTTPMQEEFVKRIKSIAEILGYELVQRVTPAARDGGRMQMEEGEDA